jgi:hypothetical protein
VVKPERQVGQARPEDWSNPGNKLAKPKRKLAKPGQTINQAQAKIGQAQEEGWLISGRSHLKTLTYNLIEPKKQLEKIPGLIDLTLREALL